MTAVIVDLQFLTGSGRAPVAGRLSWQPTHRRADGAVLVLPVRSGLDLPNGTGTADLDPGVYWFTEDVNGGESAYRIVPDAGPVNYSDLAAVDPATLEPSQVPAAAWYAYTDALAAVAQSAADSATESETSALASRNAAASSATAAAGSAETATTAAGVATAARDLAASASTSADLSATEAAQSELAAQGYRSDAAASAGAADLSADRAESARVTMVTGGAVDAQGQLVLSREAAAPVAAGYVVGPPVTLTIGDVMTGPDTPGTPGPQGLTGPKGDPGGITLGTLLGTADLNTILTSGVYRQQTTADATLARNYPMDQQSGVMTVLERVIGNTLIQLFYPIYAPSIFFERNYNNGVWSTWRAYPAQRVDQSAGRAIYTWDYVNQREQLVYGDTGWRDISASHGNGAFTVLKLRRAGAQCELICVSWVPPTNGAQTLLAALPAGFGPLHTRSFVAVDNTGSVLRASTIGSNGLITVGGNVTTSNINFSVSYMTVDNWPTVLPGVASGTIPNL